MVFVEVPEALELRRGWGSDWATWLDGLPARASEVCAEWNLTREGEAMHGSCSLVVPVRTRAGAPAMLKLGFDGDEDAALEPLALSRWAGPGVVDLLRADPRRRALLLERLGSADLRNVWDVQACEIIAARYAQLHVPAGPQFDTLSGRLARWEPGLRGLLKGAPVPRRMVEHALALVKAFRADDATDGTLVHFDLHYANMLAVPNAQESSTEARDWVVIDPQPLSGDPHVEVAPLLTNRFEEVAGDVRGGLRRRFEAAVDTALLDEDRARDWVIVRMMLNISWVLDGPTPARTAPVKDQITRWLSVAKAVQ